MIRIFRKFFFDYKEYFVLVFFLIISLSFFPLNNNTKLHKVKTYAFGSFAYLSYAADNFLDLFVNNEELNALRKENAELNLKNNLLRNYALENFELHQLLKFRNQSSFTLVPSRIISKSISKTQAFLTINIGLNDSILVGMPVINNKGLIGIVENTSDNFSVVKTINNTTLRISVLDQRSNYNGILRYNGKNFKIDNVPSSADIQIGDRIVSSDFGTLFPPSISVGIVVRKDNTVPGLVGRIFIEPSVNIAKIKNVFVVKTVISKKLNDVELNFRRELK